MFNPFQFSGSAQPLSARHLLCLLLALTFLYNPFLGAASSVHYPSVSHPPSFRATVASSELLKFLPKQDVEVLAVQEVAVVLLALVITPNLDSSARLEVTDTPIFVRHLPVGNLWFRPPPVA